MTQAHAPVTHADWPLRPWLLAALLGIAFLKAEALGQRARRDIAHDHFERHDLDFADQLLAHVDAAHEMGGDAQSVELGENVFRDPVVKDALAVDNLVLGAVSGGGVVLEVLDQRAGLGAFIEHFGLAFVNLATTVHFDGVP